MNPELLSYEKFRLSLDRFGPAISSVHDRFPAPYPTLVSILSILLLVSPWLYNNYLEFLALGPGGMPYNARGWLMALFFKMFERNTLTTKEYDRDSNKSRWLDNSKGSLPNRQGPRPNSGFHVVPVRQLNQIPPEEMAKVCHCHLRSLSRIMTMDWIRSACSGWMIWCKSLSLSTPSL